jgi:hypothetical protein
VADFRHGAERVQRVLDRGLTAEGEQRLIAGGIALEQRYLVDPARQDYRV